MRAGIEPLAWLKMVWNCGDMSSWRLLLPVDVVLFFCWKKTTESAFRM